MGKRKLTDKQKLFAAAYIETLNATEAARRAGYDGTDASLAVIGHENLKKPKIKTLIDEYLNEYAMSAAEVLYHLTDIARGDYGDMLNSMGAPDASTAQENKKTHLIKKVRTKTITTDEQEIFEVEIEPYDRLKALDLLAKFHQLTTTTRVEINWQDQAVEDIRAGNIEYEALADAFDADLATQLFTRAGVPISTE
jgi:phage terminase small subunit